MSSCEIIGFKDGVPHDSVEFRNSWGGSALIWTALFDRYLKNPNIPYDNWLCRDQSDRSLWDLASRRDIPRYARAVHCWTFDRAMVRREHFSQLVADLKRFVEEYPTKEGHVNHLQAWADWIEKTDCEAIGLHGTSVSENLWYDWDEDREESTPYNLNTDNRHFEVYDWLDAVDAEPVETAK